MSKQHSPHDVYYAHCIDLIIRKCKISNIKEKSFGEKIKYPRNQLVDGDNNDTLIGAVKKKKCGMAFSLKSVAASIPNYLL